MNFDLDPATGASQTRARAFAADVATVDAAAIDAQGRVPATVLQRALDVMPAAADAPGWVVCLEELAVASGALAMQSAGMALSVSTPGGTAPDDAAWAGLRGADIDRFRLQLADSPQWHVFTSAVLVGLGRAALEAALPTLRAARAQGGKPEQEQWPIADAATALDGARLLVWRSAASLAGDPRAVQAALAMARLQAMDASQAAVAAARRALDIDASRPGTALDRISRDVATAALVFDATDALERAVAAGVLPA